MGKKVIVFKNLEIELVKRDMDYSDLANGTGIPRHSIYRRMTGEVNWDIREMNIVANFLNKSLDYLFRIPCSLLKNEEK